MLKPAVSVVVPALNEARNIPHVFAKIPDDVHEVVLVDGYSVDGTIAIARHVRMQIFRQLAMHGPIGVICRTPIYIVPIYIRPTPVKLP